MKFKVPKDKRAEVLRLLVTKGKPVGRGVYTYNPYITIGEIKERLSISTDIDYCNGVPVKTDFSKEVIDLSLYGRDNTIPIEELKELGCVEAD